MIRTIDIIVIVAFFIIAAWFLIKGYPETIGAFIGGF